MTCSALQATNSSGVGAGRGDVISCEARAGRAAVLAARPVLAGCSGGLPSTARALRGLFNGLQRVRIPGGFSMVSRGARQRSAELPATGTDASGAR
jgi:hypothetical protein